MSKPRPLEEIRADLNAAMDALQEHARTHPLPPAENERTKAMFARYDQLGGRVVRLMREWERAIYDQAD